MSDDLFSCQRSNIIKNIVADLGNIVFSPQLSNIVMTTESIYYFILLGSNIPENIVANNDICEIKPNPICALVEQLEEESHLEHWVVSLM